MENLTPYVPWNELLNIGIKRIDDEHKHIISCINALYKHTRDKKHQDLYTPNIRLVSHAIKVHLQTEEDILVLSEYESVKEHKELHEEVRQMSALRGRFEDVDELLEHYKYWWVNHIIHEDHKYIDHLRSYHKHLKVVKNNSTP